MAFQKKTWKDRLVEFAGRRILTNISTGQSQTVDVTRSEGQISQTGDAYSAANMNDLEQRISDAFTATDKSVSDLEKKATPRAVYTANMTENTPLNIIKWLNQNTTEFSNSALGGANVLVAPVVNGTSHAPYLINFSINGSHLVFGTIVRSHKNTPYGGEPESYIFNFYNTGGADPVLKKLGRSQPILLGAGTSYNIKTLYPDYYADLTADNFIVAFDSASSTGGTRNPDGALYPQFGSISGSTTITKNYNATTGQLTIGGLSFDKYNSSDRDNTIGTYRYFVTTSISVKVYMIV